jgi:hypothetical protein
VRGGFCSRSELGRFILNLPQGKSVNETSFWSARLTFTSGNNSLAASSEFWNNPEGNPKTPASSNTSPWRRQEAALAPRSSSSVRRASESMSSALNPSPTGILTYHVPIQYHVRKTGYYCVGEFSHCNVRRLWGLFFPISSHRSGHCSACCPT